MNGCAEIDTAWSRFDAFRNRPPTWLDDDAVAQFHDIVTALEEASGEDLSLFQADAIRRLSTDALALLTALLALAPTSISPSQDINPNLLDHRWKAENVHGPRWSYVC